MFYVHNFTIRALIDTDVTHSFMSCEFSKNLIIKPKLLRQILVVETPFRGFLEVHVVYKDYKVKVLGKELTRDIILLYFFRFDVILSLDWLETYHAIIDCCDKIITLCSPKKNNPRTMGDFVLWMNVFKLCFEYLKF